MGQAGLQRDDTNDLDRIKESVKGGIAISAVSGGGNAIGNVAVNTIYNKRLQPVVETLEQEIPQIYEAIENNPTEQDINTAIEFLKNVEQQYPDLSDYLQGHINNIDRFKSQLKVPQPQNLDDTDPIKQPTTNDNIEVEQTFNEDTNVAQNSFNDVVDDIEDIDTQINNNVPEIETQVEQEEIKPIEVEQQISDYELTDTNVGNIVESKAEQPIEQAEEYSNGTIIQAKNGETYKVTSKDKDTYIVTNERTKQENEYSLGGLKRLGTVKAENKEEMQTVPNMPMDNEANIAEVNYQIGNTVNLSNYRRSSERGIGEILDINEYGYKVRVTKDNGETVTKYFSLVDLQSKNPKDFNRQDHIDRLISSMANWRENGTDKSFPEEYDKYMQTIEALKNGVEYTVSNKAEDLIKGIGSYIPITHTLTKGGTLGETQKTQDSIKQHEKRYSDAANINKMIQEEIQNKDMQAITEPTTNETETNEQLTKEDADVTQTKDKDVQEDSKADVAENETEQKITFLITSPWIVKRGRY